MTPAAPIASVRWRPWRIPLREPLATGAGALTKREGLILRIETADGLAGLGENAPLPGEGFSVASLAARLAAVAPTLVGRSPGEVWDALSSSPVRVPAADVAIETALADLLAGVCGAPARALARGAGGSPAPRSHPHPRERPPGGSRSRQPRP